MPGKVKGIEAFYQPFDWSRTREERRASNPISKARCMPKWIGETFDWAYLGPRGSRPDMKSVYLLPGLTSDEVLSKALLNRIALYNAERDALLDEEELARKRLMGLGKEVRGEVVEGVSHYWDHMGSTEEMAKLRDEVYESASMEAMQV